MVDGVNRFVLIAAPFFMLAGEIMNRGGLTRRIFRFASALVAAGCRAASGRSTSSRASSSPG